MSSKGKIITGNTYSNDERIEEKRQRFAFKRNGTKPRKLAFYEAKKFVTLPRVPVDISANLVEEEVPLIRTHVAVETAKFKPKPEEAYTKSSFGVDISTQIYSTEELFDFETEVWPLVEVIVEKTLEQSLVELKREAQLDILRSKLDGHRQREVEEAKEQKEIEEKARAEALANSKIYREAKFKYQRAEKWLRALKHLQKAFYAKGLAIDECFQKFVELKKVNEVSKEKVQSYVQNKLLAENVVSHLKRVSTSKQLTDEIIMNAHDIQSQRIREVEEARKAKENLKVEVKEVETMQVFLEGEEIFGDEKIGPIPLPMGITLEEAEERIQAWVEANLDEAIAPPNGGYLTLAGGQFNPVEKEQDEVDDTHSSPDAEDAEED